MLNSFKITRIGVVLILALAFFIQLYFALTWEMGYDEAWNHFYSKISPFRDSFVEYRHHAHPPLACFLLRISALMGNAPIWYRLPFLLSSVFSIFLFFKICQKLELEKSVSFLCIFVLAVSYPYINISVCIRYYILSTMFLLVSFYYFLDIIRDFRNMSHKGFMICWITALAAVWTEYSAVFYIAAMGGTLVIFLFSGHIPPDIFFKSILKKWWEIALFLIGTIGVYVYYKWTFVQYFFGYLSRFYLGDNESATQYFFRGISGILKYFTLLYYVPDTWIWLGILIVSSGVIYFILRFLYFKKDMEKASVFICLVMILFMLYFAGIINKYPFGGKFRHQFILYPFIVLSGIIILNHFVIKIQDKVFRYGIISAICLCFLISATIRFSGSPIEEFPSKPLFKWSYAEFKKELKIGRAIYLNNYSQFAFFYNTVDWKWHFQKQLRNVGCYYILEKDTQKIPVIVDRSNWLLPKPIDKRFVDNLDRLMENIKVQSIWVFSVFPDSRWVSAKKKFLTDQTYRHLSDHGLQVEKFMYLRSGFAFLIRQGGNSN